MKLKRLSILCAFMFAVTGCSTVNQCLQRADLSHLNQDKQADLNIGDEPTPPSDVAFPIAQDGLPAVDFIEENEKSSQNFDANVSTSLLTTNFSTKPLLLNAQPQIPPRPEPSDASNYVSLMGQNGRVITVWALARGNWLWAYASFESQDFGNIRNWKLEPSFSREHFRFINQQLGSCMQAYKNGLIHADCDPRNLAQDFELLPSNTGSVFIKSVSSNRCVTYNPVSNTGYSTLTLSPCTDQISALKDQNFYIAPPILKATPQN
ncbi:hypothetical protein B0186_07715 [Canicola haemoglobinophilus]|uniref:Cytolethal distending toxin subunit A n=1 Tax=Canicola haemoglobinophilus TaxID=733 RepID=A0A1V4B093_9PAST|nr:hypothetical protein [Canicola haemoglobinophilus]OOR99496.1 hypothetical protein B0186_07715 [Canicola haemoglobinophilus]STO59720.1 cytolethal distending toxin protein A [Canicola haemoglobinophilus]